MKSTVLKEKLHDYIEHADENTLLILSDFMSQKYESSSHVYDKETLNMLEERSAAYKNGQIEAYTATESMSRIQERIQKRNV